MSWLKSRAAKSLLGCAISVFFVWFALRGIELGQVWEALRSANYLYILPYFAILVAIHFLRTLRWGILLEPAGKPSFQRLNAASAIGIMALVLMPFRLGEMARPLLIAEKGKIRTSAAMASVVVERIVDGLAMALVLIVALLFSEPVATTAELQKLRLGGLAVFGGFFALLVFLVFAYLHRERTVGLVRRLLGRRWPGLAERLASMLDAFIGALKILPSGRKIFWFCAYTVAYWGINAFGMALLARAFGLELGVAAAFAILGVLVVGVMIPAGPGMLGTFQWAVVFGMRLFFPGEAFEGPLLAYAWVLWACQFIQQVAFGLWFVLTGNRGWSAALGGEGTSPKLEGE